MNVGTMVTISMHHAPSEQALNDLVLIRDPLWLGDVFAAFIGESLYVQLYPDMPSPDWLKVITDPLVEAGHEILCFLPDGIHTPEFPVYTWA